MIQIIENIKTIVLKSLHGCIGRLRIEITSHKNRFTGCIGKIDDACSHGIPVSGIQTKMCADKIKIFKFGNDVCPAFGIGGSGCRIDFNIGNGRRT